MADTFTQRIIDARLERGLTHRQAEAEMRKAEKRGFGKAVTFQAISNHEQHDRMPGGDVVMCYAAAYRKNPIYLITGMGPEEWDPDRYSRDANARFAAEIRNVANWMLRQTAVEGAVLTDAEMARVDGERNGKARRNA